MEKPAFLKYLEVGALVSVGIALCSTALTTGTRRVVVERENGTCQWAGDGTECRGQLEAAHINHSREDVLMNGEWVRYNDARRCLLLCTAHHLKQHQMRPLSELGLNRVANNWAINKIKERLNNF